MDKTVNAFKVSLSVLDALQPSLTTLLRHGEAAFTKLTQTVSSFFESCAEPTLRHVSQQVSYSNVVIIVIGVAVVFSALIWFLRLTCGQRKRAHTRQWSPMYRKSSYSSRSLREAINSKAPFAEALRRETVIYKMGSAFTARQRRDMF
eukprot:Gregarina_sp_Poly_1__8084@NODE_465_length_8170_cov_101_841787_g379_i0_p5_GENE_NODE_465_length_8170_cov_101_841787_g379_i0NODE_465_length_8170_cov_101_841787_g379_i0_p5_ORF_typecomplete_len148_score17_06Prominin/PF05478_11/0_0047Myc_target_1/PF15179_6/0_021Alpha_GJ/PF03229_13/0_07DUF3328/PF11807_8/0_079Mid2/PF04478_12/0_081Hum_adeno_E3A/PF05393_11/0_1Herpes_gE/PF02480_16/0_079DUF3827/PF12877_7/0_13_NODE_465_length_8170_cov_101_841787_g379_i041274570